MRRREFAILLGGGIAAWAVRARAQPAGSVRRVAALFGIANDQEGKIRFAAFRDRLNALGWVEGKNLQLDLRWAAGSPEHLASYVAEIEGSSPDVIVGTSTPVAAALHKTIKSIPIVFVVVTDPVGNGFIANMARPEGNLTGFTNFEISMGGKWIEKLKEIAPGTARVGLIFNPANSPEVRAYYGPSIDAAAKSIGVEMVDLRVRSETEAEPAISAFAREPNGGLVILPDNTTVRLRQPIVASAAAHRLPAIYPYRYFATAGGLLSYGIDSVDLYVRAASYVDRILRGAKPAE